MIVENDDEADAPEISPPVNDRLVKETELLEEHQHKGSNSDINLFSSPSLFSPSFNRTAQSIFASNPVENPILTPPITRIGKRGMDNLNDEIETMGECSFPPDSITDNNQGITLDLDSLEEVPLEADVIGNMASPSAVVESPSGDIYIPLSQYNSSIIMKSENRITNTGPHDCVDSVKTNAPSLSVAPPTEHSHHYNISRFPAASSPTNSTHSGVSEHSSFAGPCPFKHGDIVWAQTESFLPFWPGFIFIEHDKLPEHMQQMLAGVGHRRSPSGASCSNSKRKKLCVYFYGKDDFDLVLESRIKDFNSHSELRYSQSHTLGPGGAIVTFLKACHLAQEELLKEPWQRVEWLIDHSKSSISIPPAVSVPLASTAIVETPIVVNDLHAPISDGQQEESHLIAEANVELKQANVANDLHSTLGEENMIIGTKKEEVTKDSAPDSLSEEKLTEENEHDTAPSATFVPEAAADTMIEEKIITQASSSELQNPIQLEEGGEVLLVDSAEPFPNSSATSPKSIDTANLAADMLVNGLADTNTTQQDYVSDHTVIDGAVVGEELSGSITESLPNLVVELELPLNTSVEHSSSTAIAQTEEQNTTTSIPESIDNAPFKEASTFLAAPTTPESSSKISVEEACTLEDASSLSELQSTPSRKLHEITEEATSYHSPSMKSTILVSPPKFNGSEVPSKLSPFKEGTIAVKKYAPSLSLSDASTLFGGAAESGDSSIFQKPVFPAAPVTKSLFPSSSTTAGNPFDSAPSVTQIQKPISSVSNSRLNKPSNAVNDASALFGSQSAVFPPPAFPATTNTVTSTTAAPISNFSALKTASVKTARMVASDASSLFGSGATGFPESITSNAIPAKTLSQKSLAAADLFGPPPPSSEPPLFASQMATKPAFIPTQKAHSDVNPTRNRDPIQFAEKPPPVLTQKTITEKTPAVSRNNDGLFPPSQIATKSSDDFFSSHQSSSQSGTNTVGANFVSSTASDSKASNKAPTSSLSISLPFPQNASASEFAPPHASPSIVATMASSPSYLSNKSSPDQSAMFFQNTSPTDSSAPSLLTVSRSSVGDNSSKRGEATDITPSETSSDSKVLPLPPPPSGPIVPTVKSAIETFSQPPIAGSSRSTPNPPLTKKKSSGVVFHGKAQVISGASPFDFDPSGGQANPFSSIPAPQQPPSLFPPTASASHNDPFSTVKSASTPPIPNSIVANSPFKTGVINNSNSNNKSVSAEGLFSAPAPGSSSKVKLKQVPASEVFNFAPPATPTSTTSTGSDGGSRDPFSPPMAPGVKMQIQKEKDREDKADPPDAPKLNAPAPYSVSGKKSGKGPGNTSSGCPPGMMPTPHGFVPIPTVAKATSEVPKEAVVAAEDLFATTVVSPPSANPVAHGSNVMPIGPPKAPGVQISRPSAPLAERKSNLSMGMQSNEYRAGPVMQDRKFCHGRPSQAVVVAFGFGGKLLTMFPKYRPPLNPLTVSSSFGGDLATGESRCYVPSALRVYRTIDLVKASADPSSHHLVYPHPELQLFYKLLSASETFRPDAASTEAIRGFVEERRRGHVTPLYLSISDKYFAENDHTRLTEKRTALHRSEQLLWGLLAILLDNGGKLSSADTSSTEISNDSPEKAIAALLFQEESSLETLPAQLTTGSQDPDLLRQVEKLLLEGQRQDAFNLALGQGAWALALVIGSVCGAEQYQLAVRSFAATLVNSSTSATAPLYVAAMLFSNQVTQQLATVDKNALLSWRSTLCTLLCNKGSDWKDLVTLLGMKLLQEKEDVCAAHFAFLCSEIFPSVPNGSNSAGQYLLLGGDLGQGSHRSMDNVIALSALRRTETLEFILANPIYRPNPLNANTNGNANIKSSGGFSSLFNWGGGSSKSSSNVSAVSSSTSTSTSSKQQLDKIRSALAPLKLRLAIVLADFGLTKEAAEYAKGIRAIVKEAETDAGFVEAKSTSSKNKTAPPTSSSSTTAKPFNKHFVRALDEFCDRLGIVVGVDETSSTKDKEKKASSLWSVSSMFNAISAANLKEFVDGPSSTSGQPSIAQSTSSPPESNQTNLSNNHSKGNNVNSNSLMNAQGNGNAYSSYSQPPGFSLNPNQVAAPFPSNPNPYPQPPVSQSKSSDFRAADGQTWFVGENPLPGQGTTPPPTMYHGSTIQGDANRNLPPTQSQSATVQTLPKTSSTQDATVNDTKAPPTKAAAPASTAPAPAAAPAASGASTGTGDANNKGLVKTLHKGLLKWLYPNAHDASGNLGDQNVAYYDKATGKWVFPGEESNNVPDPATLAPPTGPIGQQSYLGNPGNSSNPNLPSMSGSQPSQESFDPLAALIAPPSYRIPAATNSSQHVSQLGSYNNSSNNLDPLAALMAPPSANRYSAVSYHNPNSRSMGQLAPDAAGFPANDGPPSSSSSSSATTSGPPPKISMWVPPSAANSNFNSSSSSSSSSALSSFGWDASEGQRQGHAAESDGLTTIDLNGAKSES